MSEGLELLGVLVNLIKESNLERFGSFADRTYDIIEKELKELEIIKAIGVFSVFEDVGGEYHLETRVDTVGLTKEDYDILK